MIGRLPKAGLIAALVLAAAMGWLMSSSRPAGAQESESLMPINNYGWLTYYMHEVWWRYQDAKAAAEKGDAAQLDANLVVLEMVIELSKDKLPDTLADGKPFKKQEYLASMDKLVMHSQEVRKTKKWAKAADGKEPIMATCVGCHDSYNIPTDFRLDDAFKKLTHLMHEIYELYREAGVQFMQGESTGDESHYDVAKACFVVAKPYIDEMPRNIPDVNQDGEPIDKKLFDNAHQELLKYNQGLIKQIENKYWKTGKPLPPPRIVVDTCYACHAKVVKIDNPW